MIKNINQKLDSVRLEALTGGLYSSQNPLQIPYISRLSDGLHMIGASTTRGLLLTGGESGV